MTKRKKRWLIGSLITLAVVSIGVYIAVSILAKRIEPMVREQAIRYLRDRFHSEVELTAIHLHLPKTSMLKLLLTRGRGAKLGVEGEGLSMRLAGTHDGPPMFAIRHFQFDVDMGTLLESRKSIDAVMIEGMQINVPPKGSRPAAVSPGSSGKPSSVDIKDVRIRDAVLVLMPKDKDKEPLRFEIASLRLASLGMDKPMKYEGALSIPKPPGQVRSTGTFGPWDADDPGSTPLDGDYTFENADLGVFQGIAGTLRSTGRFEGTLSQIRARGKADVPNFQLKMAGAAVPLSTEFDALIDGTNGDTILQPVKAKLGNTTFTTSGAVIKHEVEQRRRIRLNVSMPNGDIRDLLRLAAKGPPFMEGRIRMNTLIDIPPLTGTVREKLILDGQFAVRDAKFLKSTIQDQLDQLSRRGQGQPKNEEIDEVVSNMKGEFRLENQRMTFRSLAFGVPGADIALTGDYDLDQDFLDFHGNLKLMAKVSETMTGWKRWALKPVDPFFSKNGAGTFLRIQVVGNSRSPKFGMDHDKKEEAAAGVSAGK